jgi:hypothetical protein
MVLDRTQTVLQSTADRPTIDTTMSALHGSSHVLFLFIFDERDGML